MTLREIVYDVLETAYGGKIPDDNVISEELVHNWVKQYRATLIHNEITTRNKISEAFIQHLCVEFEEVDDSDCCEDTTVCKVLRSTNKLPQTILRGGHNTIISVSATDGSVGYSETTFFRKRYRKYNRFSKKNIRWFIKDGYLYLTGYEQPNLIKKLAVAGIFEDPYETAHFKDCDDVPCFTWDSRYPLTIEMAKTIVSLIVKERVAVLKQMPADPVNDSRDTTVTDKKA